MVQCMMCYKLFIGATLMILAMLIEGYDEYKVREIASVHVCAFLVYYSTVVYYISFFCERQSFLEAIQEEQNDEIYGLSDLLDVIWAPLAGWLMTRMYKGKIGQAAGVITFVEEIVPGLDVIPTFTIMWVYTYVISAKKNK